MISSRQIRSTILCSIFCAGTMSGAALAQATPASDLSQVRRLSPEEKERILQNSDGSDTDAFLNSALGGGSSTKIDGEVGVMIGSGAARSIFGTTRIPLGESGSAIISIEKSEFGRIGPDRR